MQALGGASGVADAKLVTRMDTLLSLAAPHPVPTFRTLVRSGPVPPNKANKQTRHIHSSATDSTVVLSHKNDSSFFRHKNNQ